MEMQKQKPPRKKNKIITKRRVYQQRCQELY